MAFPVVEGTPATTAGKTTSLSVNLPASIVSGELLPALITVRDNVGSMSFPAGWTEVLDDVDGSPQRVGGGLGYRVADGTEGSTFTLTFPTDKDTACIVWRVSGSAETAPEYTVATGSSSTPNPGSLTPSWGSDDTLWFAACCVDGRFPTADPTNYTDGVEINKANCYTRAVERDNATATQDPGTFTLADTEEWWCLTFAIEPAAAGSTDNLTLNDLEVTTELDTVTLGQTHVLTLNDLEATTELDTITLGQVHALTLDDLEVTTELDQVTVLEVTPVTLDDLEVITEIDTITLGQVHALVLDDLEATTELDEVTLTQEHALLLDSLEVTTELDQVTVTQVNALTLDDLEVTTELDVITLGQVHALTLDDLEVSTELDIVTLGQVHALVLDDIEATTEIDQITVEIASTVITLDDLEVASEIDQITLGQVHALSLNDLEVDTELNEITLSIIFGDWTEEVALAGSWTEEDSVSGGWTEEDGTAIDEDGWAEEPPT